MTEDAPDPRAARKSETVLFLDKGVLTDSMKDGF